MDPEKASDVHTLNRLGIISMSGAQPLRVAFVEAVLATGHSTASTTPTLRAGRQQGRTLPAGQQDIHQNAGAAKILMTEERVQPECAVPVTDLMQPLVSSKHAAPCDKANTLMMQNNKNIIFWWDFLKTVDSVLG